jgi:hypothetical protein
VKFVLLANGSKYDTNAWKLFKAVIGKEKKRKGPSDEQMNENEMDETIYGDSNLSSETTSEYSFSPTHSPLHENKYTFFISEESKMFSEK